MLLFSPERNFSMTMNASVHPDRRPNVPSATSHGIKRKKPAKSNLKSASGLRNRIRDLTRQLDRAQALPANLRVDKERELAGYRGDLEKLEEQSHRRKIVGKYHMVRFFGIEPQSSSQQVHILILDLERQKATRALKKLQRAAAALSPTSPERDSMQQAVHSAEVDLNYTIYCPLAEPYHSLYPRQKAQQTHEEPNDDLFMDGGAEETKNRAPKPPLWEVVEKAMADGTLEALRDGRSDRTVPKPPGSRRKARREKLTKHDPSRKAGGTRSAGGGPKADLKDDAEENASDGGFFEE